MSVIARDFSLLWASSDGGNASIAFNPLSAIEAECAEALEQHVHSADVIINLLTRQRDPAPASSITTPDALTLWHEPRAD